MMLVVWYGTKKTSKCHTRRQSLIKFLTFTGRAKVILQFIWYRMNLCVVTNCWVYWSSSLLFNVLPLSSLATRDNDIENIWVRSNAYELIAAHEGNFILVVFIGASWATSIDDRAWIFLPSGEKKYWNHALIILCCDAVRHTKKQDIGSQRFILL